MFDTIRTALAGRTDLLGWTVREVVGRGAQLYSVPKGVECVRRTAEAHYVIEVLADTTRPGGDPTVGTGNVTVLPGDDVPGAIEAAILRAGLVHNRPYGLPGPAPLPDVPLMDEDLSRAMESALDGAYGQLRDAAAAASGVRLSAAELFVDQVTTHLINSQGIDVAQTGATVAAEWVLLAREGGHEVETFVEMTRRRLRDLPLAEEMAQRARWTRDLLAAGAPPTHRGAVVLRDQVLAEFMNGGVIQTLASASQKFAKASTWEVGNSVLPEADPDGDPLTVWANRQMPYGVGANRFDSEGIPSQRLALIEDNVLQAFSASQRYAEYLGIPATGEFGVIEVAPGRHAALDLLAEPHVEIAAFSWFNPDTITGDFACEIRLAYVVVDGTRTPFKGGQLIGNYLQALSSAQWSRETRFYGAYHGPTTVRFQQLTVAA